MRIFIGIIVIVIICLGIIVRKNLGFDNPTTARTVTETVYRTPSGQACTEQDWIRQYMHGLKPGEEKCTLNSVIRPMTEREKEAAEQQKKAADRRQKEKEYAHYEELRMNCVLLSRTPMSAMTPKDLDDWDFCKQIMVRR